MLIHCDPKRAQRESCNELPATEVKQHGLRSAQHLLRFVVQSGLPANRSADTDLQTCNKYLVKHLSHIRQQVGKL